MSTRKIRLIITTIAGLGLASVLAAVPATAQDVIATDASGTPVAEAAQPKATQPQATASIPRGIVVARPGGSAVTLTAKGQPTLRKPRPGNSPAVFTGLHAGTSYTVSVGGRVVGHVTAVDRPKPAAGLSVTTAATAGTVDLKWRYSATAATGGRQISFDVAAMPTTGSTVTTTVSGRTSAQLTGLDPKALYTFSVTPRNTAGKGAPSTAVMHRSLAELTGGSTDAPKGATPPTPAAVAIPVPAATPATPAPAPAPAPRPSSVTIYVCPDGFSEVGGLCQKTLAYTFHTETVTTPYTYHQDAVQTGTVEHYSADCSGGGVYYPNNNPPATPTTAPPTPRTSRSRTRSPPATPMTAPSG
jgi:antitoxin (DNA-binding transcriptional repressor) of toxin-antitoxin stability system